MSETYIPNLEYENVRYTPTVGQVWAYDDKTIENTSIEWEITEIDDSEMAHVLKLTGKDIGYKGTVPVTHFGQPNWWRLIRGPKGSESLITFSCPGCGEENPILKGDYICMECRK